MKPIRSNELNYLDTLINDKFRSRRQNIESEIEAATQKQTDKNYSKFVEKLGLKAEIKAFKEADIKLKTPRIIVCWSFSSIILSIWSFE